MSSEQDLKQLLQQMKRMADAFERSSASASDYQVRSGRGGNSNGRVSRSSGNNNGSDSAAIERAERDLEKILLRNSKAADGWEKAIRNATGITTLFGESVKESINRIDAHNAVQSEATRRVTAATMELAKANGVQSRIVKDSNAQAFKYRDTIRDLINKNEEAVAAVAARTEVEDRLAKKTRELRAERNAGAKVLLAQQVDAIQKEADAIKSVQAFATEIKDLEKELVQVAKQIDTDVNPAFHGLADSVKETADATDSHTFELNKLKDNYKVVNPLVNAQGNATKQLTMDIGKLSDGIEKGKQAIVNSLKTIADSLGNAAKQAVGNFREQLKYNVKDSNYLEAAKMGMGDGELSKVLGENADTFRAITGSADYSKILDGSLQKLQKTALQLYGESGADGARRVAQMSNITQLSGISTRNNPEVIDQRLKAFSSMADRLGMVKGSLVDFAQQLSESGDMAYLASKYEGMESKAASAALDRELEARIANAKMLGQGTEHIKQQIQLERAARYGSGDDLISNVVGANLDIAIAKQMGVDISPEMKAIMVKSASGGDLSPDERAKLELTKLNVAAAHEQKLKQAIAAGDTNAVIALGIKRGVAVEQGGTLFTKETLTASQNSNAARIAKLTPEERAAYENHGILPESFRGDGRNAEAPDSFSSALLPFEQLSNLAAQGIEGIFKNPLATLVSQGFITIGLLTKIAFQKSLMNLWKRGRGGLPTGGGVRGGINSYLRNSWARGAANSSVWRAGSRVITPMAARTMASPLMGSMVRGATAMGTAAASATGALGRMLPSGAGVLRGAGNVLGKVAAPLAGALGAYNGWQESKEKGESTGNGVSRAVGSGGGALAGAAIGGALGTALIPIPVLGTAIGMAVGGWIGESAGNKIGDGVWDTVSGEADGPAAKLEATRTEADRVRAEAAKPQQVEIIGPAGEAIIITGNNTKRLADLSDKQVIEQQKQHEQNKTAADVRAMLHARDETITAAHQRFAAI